MILDKITCQAKTQGFFFPFKIKFCVSASFDTLNETQNICRKIYKPF